MRYAVLSLILAILACGAGDDLLFEEDIAPDTAGTITIQNTTDIDICDIYISPSTADDWGFPVNDSILFPGDSASFEVPGETFDVLAVDCDNNDVAEEYGFDPLEASTWQISGGVVEQPPDDAPVIEAPPGETATILDSPDLRQIRYGELRDGASVEIEIGPDDVSFLFTAEAVDSTEYVIIQRVDGPNGPIYTYDWDTDEYQSDQIDEPLWAAGEASVYLPVAPQFDLQPGTYTITVGTDFGGNIEAAYALVRSGNVDGTQAVDMNFWIVSPEPSLADPAVQAEIEQIIRADMNRLMAPHDLQVGRIAFTMGTDEQINQFEVLRNQGDDEDLREACLAMNLTVGDTARAANIVVVESLTAPREGIGPGDIAGVSLGRPGSAMMPGAEYNCTFVALDGFYNFTTNEFGHTAIHELAHAMSLPHTTESDGVLFDLFDDTPECPADNFDTNNDGEVDPDECAGQDGGNFMFWTGEAFTMSADQAWVLRRHPLFYTVEN